MATCLRYFVLSSRVMPPSLKLLFQFFLVNKGDLGGSELFLKEIFHLFLLTGNVGVCRGLSLLSWEEGVVEIVCAIIIY